MRFNLTATGFSMTAGSYKIGIIGLGYVGLPLAVEFGKKFDTIGFDINAARVQQLNKGIDETREIDSQELQQATHLSFTFDAADLIGRDIFIVTVPTPINESKQPDLRPLEHACHTLSSIIRPGAIVVFESTVYPGCTEEFCVPIIEKGSGLIFNQDFYAGYSPERINPGDKQRRIHNIIKTTSGSTPKTADTVDTIYRAIVTAGTHKTRSIKIAEAAKVIENTQRDINIALINELALIFKRMDLDTQEVLEAAGTKWNFLPFRPGLVGGHCISVDPYYLTHKAQQLGYTPEVILAGRRINDYMGVFVAESVVKLMTQRKCHVVDSNILIMGLAFKENCPDLRNTRVIDTIHELQAYNAKVHVYDPWVNPEAAKLEYNLDLVDQPLTEFYDAIILCVAHDEFRNMGADQIRRFGKPQHLLYDVKHIFPKECVDARL